MYEETTHDISVSVEPTFLDDQSDPEDGRYVWAYHITIKNKSNFTVQLISRHWEITNGRGERQEVIGDGVVGQQPVLKPGQAFDYSSGCPLTTPTGIMVGTFSMLTGEAGMIQVKVPAFSLDSPYDTAHVH